MGRLSGFKPAALGAGFGIGALNWINPLVGVVTVVSVALIVIFAMAINAQFVWRVRKPEGESQREFKIKGRLPSPPRAALIVPKQTGSDSKSEVIHTAPKKSGGKG